MTMSHPEYYLDPHARRLSRAISGSGGRLMYMGGNGFYWRVAYPRRQAGRHRDAPRRGRLALVDRRARRILHEFHRRTGRPVVALRAHAPEPVVGIGFIAQGFDCLQPLSPDRGEPRSARRLDLRRYRKDELIGDFGLLGGGAAGWELDCADPLRGTPPHALVLSRRPSTTPTRCCWSTRRSATCTR